jgi:hypothetical protein
MPRPCRSPAMPCRLGFRLCLSHLIYTVRPCLIRTYHAVLKATSQSHGTARHGQGMGKAWNVWISIGRPETACGRPAHVRLLPPTTWSSKKVVIRSIPIRYTGLAVQIFPATTRTFTKGRGAAWHVWISLKDRPNMAVQDWSEQIETQCQVFRTLCNPY